MLPRPSFLLRPARVPLLSVTSTSKPLKRHEFVQRALMRSGGLCAGARRTLHAAVLLLLPSVLSAGTSAGSAPNPPCPGALLRFAVGPRCAWQHSLRHGRGLRGGGVEGENDRLDAQPSRHDHSDDIAALEDILELVRGRVLCLVPRAPARIPLLPQLTGAPRVPNWVRGASCPEAPRRAFTGFRVHTSADAPAGAGGGAGRDGVF